jgi:hypothetical protein
MYLLRYCLAGACLNSPNGIAYYVQSPNSPQNFWYLKLEAKYDMEDTHDSLQANIDLARKNFDAILLENDVKYCFNTNMPRICK